MIKLIASDMDGTLLNNRGELDNEIYDIINRLKELGIIFTAASGRQLESLKKRFLPVDNDIIYLAENGTYVVYKGEEIYSNVMNRNIVEELVDKIKNIGDCACFLCGKKRAYCENDELIEFMRQPIFGYDIVKINDISEIDDDILKVSLFDSVDPRERSYKILEPEYRGRMYLATSGYNCLDIMNIDASKGTAIKEICRKFGIDKKDTVSFGDNYNDLEMFAETGMSYAMLNADEYVRNKADKVIGSNDENAVIETLKGIIEEIH